MAEYVIGKNPCRFRGCGSSDGFHWYGEGQGGHCFVCMKSVLSDEKRAELGLDEESEDEEYVVTREKITPEENAKIKSYTGTDGKDWRGIRKETNAFFGVRYEYDEETGEPIAQYFPTTVDYELAGYRVRKFPKDFSKGVGKVGKECDMVGEFRFRNHNRTVLIVGGETKLLNAYQMLKDDQERRGKGEYETVAVVCSTLGEPGAYKQVQQRYEFFNQFQKIIICMDADEPGEKAAQDIAKVLPKGKAFIMRMRYKDADDYVEAGKQRDFVSDYWNAQAYTPDGIVASSSLSQKIREAATVEKIPLPPFMHKLEKMMAGGIPLGVIVNLASASGTGKSTILDELMYYWIFHSPHRISVVTLESDAGQWGTKILSRHMSKKIDLFETVAEKLEFLDREETKAAEYDLFHNEDGTPRFHLVEERDGGIESLKELVMNLIISCGCKVVVLDPLQDLLDGLSNEDQAVFMRWMKGMVKSHNVTFILVNHVRKSGGGQKANSAGAELHEEDMHGSSSILKSGACNLLFTRNKEAEDPIERNTTKMKASKIRWTGNTGMAGEYYYDNATHTLFDKEDWLASQPAVEF